MALTFDQVASVAVPLVAVVVWLVRLEGRVNGHDREHRDTKEDIRYIRDRIDSALGVGARR